ncbi:hypothetical protein H6P81_006678 [Aristolochia fimbriata]|uniref:GST N-terminal domain-containing protein n=1 Tax=Aristolochia fimbriata TaxID=158543 RepID=A0AAV7EZC4_ARIFI|nr:hypothetical protein H6P81_006678 [Aristolochia fimbriata]
MKHLFLLHIGAVTHATRSSIPPLKAFSSPPASGFLFCFNDGGSEICCRLSSDLRSRFGTSGSSRRDDEVVSVLRMPLRATRLDHCKLQGSSLFQLLHSSPNFAAIDDMLSYSTKEILKQFPFLLSLLLDYTVKFNFLPFDLKNRPNWYKEKVYPLNKVPSLERDNKIIGESLEVVKYIDTHFEGPKLIPEDPERKEFAEEMAAYSDTFVKNMWNTFRSNGDAATEMGPTLDHLENCLSKFEDGPFLVGHFSIADIAFVTFVEEARNVLLKEKNYDITTGRPKLKIWIEEMHKIDAYTVTKVPPHT